jgi:DNA-binding GntR family transcriptional regulator
LPHTLPTNRLCNSRHTNQLPGVGRCRISARVDSNFAGRCHSHKQIINTVRAVTPEQAIAAVRAVFGSEKHYIEAHLLPAEGDL